MPRKKIAIVNVFYPPQSIGGATRVVAENLDILHREYADVFELVGFTTDNGNQAAHTLQGYVHNGHRVYRIGHLQRQNMDWHPRDPEMGRLFSEFLEFEKPDLVHFHCIQRLSGSVVEAAASLGIPYIVTVHDAWWISDYQFLFDQDTGAVYPNGHPDPTEPVPPPVGVAASVSRERRDYLKSLLARARVVLPVSETFADIYRRNGVANVSPNRNGVPDRKWMARTPSTSGKVRLAHIGGMAAHKGYHLFKEALSGGGFSNLEAIVVDLSKPFGYEHQSDWNGVAVRFIGKVPQARTEELYASMDVLVAPSLWPESFGLVTREAAAAGVWVVASDVGAIGEDVRPGIDGDRVEGGSLSALRESLMRIDRDPEPYKHQLPGREFPGLNEQVRKLAETYNQI